MTNKDLQEIRATHDRLDLLEHQGRFADADKFFSDNRAAFDWDRDGNYVGSVANENGWTA